MLQVVRKKTFVILHEERRTDGLYLYTERGLIRITPWSDSVIAVSYTKKDTFAAGYGIGITDRPDFRQWHFISTDLKRNCVCKIFYQKRKTFTCGARAE